MMQKQKKLNGKNSKRILLHEQKMFSENCFGRCVFCYAGLNVSNFFAESKKRKSQWAQIETQIDSKYFHNREKSLTTANTQCTHISRVIKLFNPPCLNSFHLFFIFFFFFIFIFGCARFILKCGIYIVHYVSHSRGVFDEHFYGILNIKIIVCKAHPLPPARAMMINIRIDFHRFIFFLALHAFIWKMRDSFRVRDFPQWI